MSQLTPEIRKELDALKSQRDLNKITHYNVTNRLQNNNSTIRCHQPRNENLNSVDFRELVLPPRNLNQFDKQANFNQDLNSDQTTKLSKQGNPSSLLNNFPKEIDGGTVREVVAVENPAIRLVHIKQYHASHSEEIRVKLLSRGYEESEELDLVCKEFTEELDRCTEMSQADIKKIELDLIDNYGISEIYAEGISGDFISHPKTEYTLKNADEILENLTKRKLEINDGLRDANISEDEVVRMEYEREMIDGKSAQFEFLKKTMGATGELYKEGKLKNIRALEDESLLDDMENIQNNFDRKEFDENMDQREDFSLIEINKKELNNDGIAPVVLGGAHSYENNIRAWNKLHPDRQIALTEITPDANESVRTELDSIKVRYKERIAKLDPKNK